MIKTCFVTSHLTFSIPPFIPGQRARRQQIPAGLLQPVKEPHGRPEEAQEGEGQEEPAVEEEEVFTLRPSPQPQGMHSETNQSYRALTDEVFEILWWCGGRREDPHAGDDAMLGP